MNCCHNKGNQVLLFCNLCDALYCYYAGERKCNKCDTKLILFIRCKRCEIKEYREYYEEPKINFIHY